MLPDICLSSKPQTVIPKPLLLVYNTLDIIKNGLQLFLVCLRKGSLQFGEWVGIDPNPQKIFWHYTLELSFLQFGALDLVPSALLFSFLITWSLFFRYSTQVNHYADRRLPRLEPVHWSLLTRKQTTHTSRQNSIKFLALRWTE